MSNYPVTSDHSNSENAYSIGNLAVRDRDSRDTTEHDPSCSSSRQSLDMLKIETDSLVSKDNKQVYSGPQHRKYTQSLDILDENHMNREANIHKIVWEELPEQEPVLKSNEMASTLQKLSEALSELSIAEKGLDERVISYILKSKECDRLR